MAEKPEITAGIKQAIERGYSLGQAKASFLNAGYNAKDIEDSSRALGGISARIPEENFPTPQSGAIPASSQISYQQKPQLQQQTKSSKLKILVIILAIILVLLVAGLVMTIFFKDKAIEILGKIGLNVNF